MHAERDAEEVGNGNGFSSVVSASVYRSYAYAMRSVVHRKGCPFYIEQNRRIVPHATWVVTPRNGTKASTYVATLVSHRTLRKASPNCGINALSL